LRSEWRRHKHVTWIPFTPPQGYGDDLFDEPSEEYLVSDEIFEDQVVQRDLIRRVLAQLPKASATCLLLDAEGFSYREIAEILEDTLSAVRSRLSRARQAFQQIYTRLDREGR
jgi:RNA polymerase sigma-70 factor (ECF subfamily)